MAKSYPSDQLRLFTGCEILSANVMMTAIRSEEDLVATCVTLGAGQSGGRLSDAERQLVERGSPPRTAAGWLDSLRQVIRAGGDPLGEAFCSIRSGAERRRSGAFYTDPSIVDSMVS